MPALLESPALRPTEADVLDLLAGAPESAPYTAADLDAAFAASAPAEFVLSGELSPTASYVRRWWTWCGTEHYGTLTIGVHRSGKVGGIEVVEYHAIRTGPTGVSLSRADTGEEYVVCGDGCTCDGVRLGRRLCKHSAAVAALKQAGILA